MVRLHRMHSLCHCRTFAFHKVLRCCRNFYIPGEFCWKKNSSFSSSKRILKVGYNLAKLLRKFNTRLFQTPCTWCRRRSGRPLRNRYRRGSGPIWLDNLRCTGQETQLGHCRHNGWGRHNCGHNEDVSISCSDDSSPTGLNTTHFSQHSDNWCSRGNA